MTSSVNGNKFSTPQWNRNDEFNDCEVPFDSPDSKVNGRPTTFCKQVTMLENLDISGDVVIGGNVTINGNLTVSGTIKAPFFDGLAKEAIKAQSIG